MRKSILTVAAVAIFAALPAVAHAQRLVYVVRHAERADDGMAASARQADPALSDAGEQRAEKLAAMLADAGVKAIYATQYRRTQDTGRPLATRLGLEVRVNPAGDTDALVARLRAEHANDVVVVVGHSNTVPAIIKAFGGPDVAIGENEYDTLYVVVPATGTLSRIKF